MEPFLDEKEKPGYTLFWDDSGGFWWKDCETSGCENQICTWLSNRLCYPCTLKSAKDSAAASRLAQVKEGPE